MLGQIHFHIYYYNFPILRLQNRNWDTNLNYFPHDSLTELIVLFISHALYMNIHKHKLRYLLIHFQFLRYRMFDFKMKYFIIYSEK